MATLAVGGGPRDLEPGRHRLCKRSEAEDAGINDVTLHAEFTVEPTCAEH